MMEPKIRLKGFSGEWKDCLYGDHIISVQTGTNLLGDVWNKGIPLLKMGNIQRGYFDFEKLEYLNEDVCPNDSSIAKYGDFFYNTRNTLELVGKGATWMHKSGLYAFNSNIAKCVFSGIDTFFFNYLYNTNGIIKQVQARAKGTTSVAAVYLSDLKSIQLSLPTYEEQRALATFFTSLNNQISAAEKRLASLKQVKAASLQAMFPQDGETTPKLRFKGFEGEWKKVKLGEVFEHIKNNSLSRDNLATEGLVMNVHYGDILIKFGAYIDTSHDDIPFIKDDNLANTMLRMGKLQCGDVIIADAAEDNTVGKCSELIVNNANIVSGLHTIVIRPKLKFASCYLGYYMNSPSYHNQLLPHIQGSKISSISKKAVDSTYINYPSLSEQRQIASYFTTLDRQITSQSSKILKLKQIKSACLDQMFV